jgi:hypothetical protein
MKPDGRDPEYEIFMADHQKRRRKRPESSVKESEFEVGNFAKINCSSLGTAACRFIRNCGNAKDHLNLTEAQTEIVCVESSEKKVIPPSAREVQDQASVPFNARIKQGSPLGKRGGEAGKTTIQQMALVLCVSHILDMDASGVIRHLFNGKGKEICLISSPAVWTFKNKCDRNLVPCRFIVFTSLHFALMCLLSFHFRINSFQPVSFHQAALVDRRFQLSNEGKECDFGRAVHWSRRSNAWDDAHGSETERSHRSPSGHENPGPWRAIPRS